MSVHTETDSCHFVLAQLYSAGMVILLNNVCLLKSQARYLVKDGKLQIDGLDLMSRLTRTYKRIDN